MKFLRPKREHVESHIGIPIDASGLVPPTYDKEEWNKSHRLFVLHVLLPEVRPPKRTWRICAEAYLTDILFEKDHPNLGVKAGDIRSFEEILCDGSSVVPDWAYHWGFIKDPWAMGHDLNFTLHRLGWRDVFGHRWGLLEAHAAYRDGWIAQDNPVVGNLWYFGLFAGAWPLWFRGFDDKPEKVTGWQWKENTGCEPFLL